VLRNRQAKRNLLEPLFERPDFEPAQPSAQRNIFASAICVRRLQRKMTGKHSYVTQALRTIAIACGDQIIFKGGTSLAKRMEPERAFLGGGYHLSRSGSISAMHWETKPWTEI
jgi:hypothetical protein